MSDIFVTADQHFSHANIIKYCNRPFNNIANMEHVLISKWNKVVKDEDYVLVLGDFFLGNKDHLSEILQQLNGHKILIKGNHDHYTKSFYLEAGFEYYSRQPLTVQFPMFDYPIVLSHAPIKDLPAHQINVHGHLHNQPQNDSRHICVSVELYDYTPILLTDIIQSLII